MSSSVFIQLEHCDSIVVILILNLKRSCAYVLLLPMAPEIIENKFPMFQSGFFVPYENRSPFNIN